MCYKTIKNLLIQDTCHKKTVEALSCSTDKLLRYWIVEMSGCLIVKLIDMGDGLTPVSSNRLIGKKKPGLLTGLGYILAFDLIADCIQWPMLCFHPHLYVHQVSQQNF